MRQQWQKVVPYWPLHSFDSSHLLREQIQNTFRFRALGATRIYVRDWAVTQRRRQQTNKLSLWVVCYSISFKCHLSLHWLLCLSSYSFDWVVPINKENIKICINEDQIWLTVWWKWCFCPHVHLLFMQSKLRLNQWFFGVLDWNT